MSDTSTFTRTGRVIQELITRHIIETMDEGKLREYLQPIIRDLVAEEVPRALRATMPDIIREIDRDLAKTLEKSIRLDLAVGTRDDVQPIRGVHFLLDDLPIDVSVTIENPPASFGPPSDPSRQP